MNASRVVAALFCLLATRPGWAAPETVRIGLASNFSEPSSSSSNPYGDYFRNGVRLALDHAQLRLDKRGLTISLEEFDYGTAQIRVRDAATRAAASKVIGVLGYNFSSHALLAAPLHQTAKLPMLTPSATADRISRMGAFVHVACFDNSFIGSALARVARGRLKAKRAAVVVAADCAYCQDLARAFEAEFTRDGGTVAVRSEVLDSDKDFGPTLEQLKAAQFDVVLVPNQELNSARIISALIQSGIHKPFLGGDGWGNVGDEFFAVLGDQNLEGFSVSHWHPDVAAPRSRRFVHDYIARFRKQPNDTSVLAYDATLLLVEAILSAKSRTREGLDAALTAIRQFEGVTGSFRFRTGEAPAKNMVLLSANKRRFKVVDTIAPSAHGGVR
jgi:branched-chain amino acid transport system substrate-binding protein